MKTPTRTAAETRLETGAHSQLWPSAHLLTVTKKIRSQDLGCPSYLHRQHDSVKEEAFHYSVNSENVHSSCTLLSLSPPFETGLGHCFCAHRLRD